MFISSSINSLLTEVRFHPKISSEKKKQLWFSNNFLEVRIADKGIWTNNNDNSENNNSSNYLYNGYCMPDMHIHSNSFNPLNFMR